MHVFVQRKHVVHTLDCVVQICTYIGFGGIVCKSVQKLSYPSPKSSQSWLPLSHKQGKFRYN